MFKDKIRNTPVASASLLGVRVFPPKAVKKQAKPASTTKDALIHEIANRWGRYCSRPNRKRLHRFLLEVYSTGISLEDGRDQRRAIKKLTEIGKLRPRGPLDIFTALIAAGSIEGPADGKQRSRWSRGLRHIASKDVAAQNFGAYLRRKGGICKAADRYARSRRQTESLRNRRR